MPTNKEARDAKTHLEKVDYAQEIILDQMFEDLRINYESDLSKKAKPDS